MKKLVLLLLIMGSFTIAGQAAEPAILLQKPGLRPGQQLSEYVQFYLNPEPVKKGSKVHQLYVYMGQTELTGRVAISLMDDGGMLFQTNDLMEGNYNKLGMAIVLIELERKLSENLNSVKLKTVRAKSRLIQSPRDRTRKTTLD